MLTKAAQEVWTAYEDLLSGQITVGNLSLLQENLENFLKIIKIMIERNQQKDTRFSDTLTTTLVEVRDKEIKNFQRILRDVGIFAEMCQHFSGKQIFFSNISSEVKLGGAFAIPSALAAGPGNFFRAGLTGPISQLYKGLFLPHVILNLLLIQTVSPFMEFSQR